MFVLGAGADRTYGVPLIYNLLPELAAFSRGEGEPISRTLKKQLPHLVFSFDKYAAKRSDAFLAELFASASDIAPTLRSATRKLATDPEMQPVASLIDKLCQQAEANFLVGADLSGIAHIANALGDVGDAEPLLDPSRISLTHLAGAALRGTFQHALIDGPSFSDRERDVLALFVESTSNIEELLSHYFTLYSLGKASDQRNYLYISWMLWAFLRLASGPSIPRDNTIQARLPQLGGDVITFNYTSFFDPHTAKSVPCLSA